MENIEPATSSFKLDDIYYTLFRHKWKILLCTLTGLVAAGVFWKLNPAPFQSSARLFIRYVVTEREGSMGQSDSLTKSPDARGGETILNAELQILSSLDVAAEVAKNVGPEKILAKNGGGASLSEATGLVMRGLNAEVVRHSSVLQLTFQNSDPDIVQPVMREVINTYLRKHQEVHRSAGMIGDPLTQETDQLRARLNQTEEELRKVKNRAGIFSLEEFKSSTAQQVNRIRQEIFDTQAQMAERAAVLEQYTKTAPATGDSSEPAPVIPPDVVADYRGVLGRLELLRRREQELLTQFSESSTRVREVRFQIAQAVASKAKLEKDQPALSQIPSPVSSKGGSSFDVQGESTRLIALKAKIQALNAQLESLRADVAKVDQLENSILELSRRKSLEEANYTAFSKSLEQSRIAEQLSAGRVSNISEIESPTPPGRDLLKTKKIAGGIAGGGLGLGLVWAFAIELLFDRSLRRGSDVERLLRIPLFLSIPKLKASSLRRLKAPAKSQTLLTAAMEKSETNPVSSSTDLALLSGGSQLALDPYYETLRDRLISYFESVNLRHNPKLVAVTGLGQDSGVTTIAAGLAKSLSQTGEGNVLLVDMTQGQGSAQHFHKGKSSVNIDELLDQRSDAKVDSNLYVVGESSNSEKLARGIPQRFNQLVPKLKTSDFDYIIFDMPPVSQISITPRLASFMDMVLMVVESEKTDRDLAQKATELLTKSKTHLGVILNKTKSYAPGKLHQDKGFLLGT